MTETTLSVLHLTDLHIGQPNHERFYHTMCENFLDDLQRCRKKSGPWDLVVFSGDLAFSGAAEQFEQVDRFLDDLQSHLTNIGGNDMVLLAVPGNHDLRRPADPTDPVATVLANLGTMSERDTNAYWKEILDSQNSPYRQSIESMFAAYMSWWKPWADKARANLKAFRDGILPGEFAAQFEKDGARFGIVGLNTTFLQVKGGNFCGKLAVDARQLLSLLPPGNRGWLQQMSLWSEPRTSGFTGWPSRLVTTGR